MRPSRRNPRSNVKIIHLFLPVVTLAIGGFSSSAPTGSQVPLTAAAWDIQYSPGMPVHPTAVAGGWYFDFPAPSCGTAEICSVHYVSTPAQLSLIPGGHINAAFEITTSAAVIFNYRLNPNNTCA